MSELEFTARQAETEQLTVHVIWMTSGLGCDGDTVAMTAATQPSLEDLLTRALPGMPGVALYNPFLAVESGDDFMRAWYDAEAGRLDPFILVLEGAVPNERINGDGHWAALGTDPATGQPITTNEWIDRLAPRAAIVLALGHLRHVTAGSRRCGTTRPARWACATTSAAAGARGSATRS